MEFKQNQNTLAGAIARSEFARAKQLLLLSQLKMVEVEGEEEDTSSSFCRPGEEETAEIACSGDSFWW